MRAEVNSHSPESYVPECNVPEFEIIVPVYNALAETARCLDSVIAHSTRSYRLVIVNDASDETTTRYLREFIKSHPATVLLENPINVGFLHSANRGLELHLRDAAQCAVIKLLLNSDTIVAPQWLEAFSHVFHVDERVGLATPLSNNAENLTVTMPQGFTIYTMARMVQSLGTDTFCDVTTAIGFCMAMRSSVLREVGLFDEAFSPGYGEESDLHFRVLYRGYRSVVVAGCYIYHQNHASFSERKTDIVAKNRPIFERRWLSMYDNELSYNGSMPVVERVRRKSMEQAQEPRRHELLFILPTSKLFGGVIVVYEICNRLIQRGVDANVIILSEPTAIEMDRPSISWRGPIPEAQTYVATHFETCGYGFRALSQFPQSKLAYLIQGYEGWFPGDNLGEVVDTYRAIPNRIVVSHWLKDLVARWGCDSIVVPNGVDTQFFHPHESLGSAEARAPRLLLMLRQDPQGGFGPSLEILEKLKLKLPQLEVTAVGNLANEPRIRKFVDVACPSADRKKMRELYQHADVFLDCSMVQGFGMTGLEAMASGVTCVVSATGGVQEYANAENAILCPLGDLQSLIDGVVRVATDRSLRAQLRNRGIETAAKFTWDAAVEQYQKILCGPLQPLDLSNALSIHRVVFDQLLAIRHGESAPCARSSLRRRFAHWTRRFVRFVDRIGMRKRAEGVAYRIFPAEVMKSIRRLHHEY
jgi:GT2 family glycosyltransferase/glycosyltransferase involved in cell wall biosynthesis